MFSINICWRSYSLMCKKGFPTECSRQKLKKLPLTSQIFCLTSFLEMYFLTLYIYILHFCVRVVFPLNQITDPKRFVMFCSYHSYHSENAITSLTLRLLLDYKLKKSTSYLC